ncbi:hypothetical protein [Xanthomonas sp. 60]
MKYLPLLEMAFCVILIYLIPEGIYQVTKRRLGLDQSPFRKFIVTNVKGFLFGSVVTLLFLFAFGVSYEDFTSGTVRKLADVTRRMVGMDSVAICVRRSRERFRYDARDFLEASASFQPFGRTLEERELLLSEGWRLIMLPRSPGSEDTPEALYHQALTAHCSRK